MDADTRGLLTLVMFVINYVILPVGCIYGLWRLWGCDIYIRMDEDHWSGDNIDLRANIKRELKRTKVFFVAFLIISFSVWGLTFSIVSDNSVRSENVGSFLSPLIMDPVIESLGPSYDTASIVEEMEEYSLRWMYEDIAGVVDFDDLTRLPGRLAVYRLRDTRYIITYTYLTPVPMMRAYGFRFVSIGDGTYQMIHSREETYIYPMYPDITGIADPW